MSNGGWKETGKGERDTEGKRDGENDTRGKEKNIVNGISSFFT